MTMMFQLGLILFCLITKRSVGDNNQTSLIPYFGANDDVNDANTTTNEYAIWLKSKAPSLYLRHTFLTAPQNGNPNEGMAVHWTIQGEEIQLAVAAKTTGWLGFGIAEAGGMKGSDIFLFDAKTEQVVDSYVLDENIKPLPDDCQSWKLVESFVGEDFLIVELTRLLDTNDLQDRAFRSDGEVFQYATRVIGAWGDSETPTFHGPNFVKGNVRFFGSTNTDSLLESFRSSMELDANGTFFIGASNYTVPNSTDTTYIDFCVTYEELVAQGVLNSTEDKKHIIGIEPIIDPRSLKHVHHFVLGGSTNPGNYDCQDAPSTELIYLWAPGGLTAQPPPQVGIPLGGVGGYLSFSIEVHYDNPELLAGIVDSSGVNVYYTSTIRKYDQGILSLGDPSVAAQPEVLSVNGGLTQHSFFCPSKCTQTYFGQEVTVYAEALHMHMNGKAMQNQQIRNGTMIRRGVSQYFDFDQQGAYEVIQAPFPLQPGDAFNVICSYDADRGERWGLASSDEMCIAYLFYYPRQVIPFVGETGQADQLQPFCGVGIGDFLPGCEVDHIVTPDFTHLERADREFGQSVGPGGTTCSGQGNNNNTINNGKEEEGSTTSISGTPGLCLGFFTICLMVGLY